MICRLILVQFRLRRFSALLNASSSTALCIASLRLDGLACFIFRRMSASYRPSKNCSVASISFRSLEAVGYAKFVSLRIS